MLALTPDFNGFGQRQLQDETRNIKVMGFDAIYARGLPVDVLLPNVVNYV